MVKTIKMLLITLLSIILVAASNEDLQQELEELEEEKRMLEERIEEINSVLIKEDDLFYNLSRHFASQNAELIKMTYEPIVEEFDDMIYTVDLAALIIIEITTNNRQYFPDHRIGEAVVGVYVELYVENKTNVDLTSFFNLHAESTFDNGEHMVISSFASYIPSTNFRTNSKNFTELIFLSRFDDIDMSGFTLHVPDFVETSTYIREVPERSIEITFE